GIQLGISGLDVILGKGIAGFPVQLDAIRGESDSLRSINYTRRTRKRNRFLGGCIFGAVGGSCLCLLLVVKIAALVGGNNFTFLIELCRELARGQDSVRLAGSGINNLCVGRAIERDRAV